MINFSPTQASIFLLLSWALAAVGTIWYARRPGRHSIAISLLVIFAWLMPMVGPVCLLIFLAASNSRTQADTKSQHVT